MHKRGLSQCCVVVPNEPGALSKVTQLLAREGVNIDCLMTESLGDIASLRFLMEKENGLRRKLESAGYKVLCVEFPNRPVELNKLVKRFADEGLDIRYLYGTSHGPTTKVILAVDRPEKAARLAEEAGASIVAV
jgi:hypothetical protein